MQIINRKERNSAKWRFAGLYTFSVALVGLVLLSGSRMSTIDRSENKEQLVTFKNKEEVLAKLSELTLLLDRVMELKKPYDSIPSNPKDYDRMREEFKRKMEPLKSICYSDTTLYRSDLKLIYLLEGNYERYRQISENFAAQLDEQVKKEFSKIPKLPRDGGDNTKLELLQDKLDTEKAKNRNLEAQLQGNTNLTKQMSNARSLAGDIEQDIDKLINDLNGIAEESKNIRRKNANYQAIQTSISDQVQNLKVDANRVKNTSRSIKLLN